MRKNTEREPRTEVRYLVYLNKDKQSLFSKSYKTDRGALEAVERLNKKYGHLGYKAVIRTGPAIV